MSNAPRPILDAVQAERDLVAQIRGYLDRREKQLDEIEQLARSLDPLNFDPSTLADEQLEPALRSLPGNNGHRERELLPGLPQLRTRARARPPAATQEDLDERRRVVLRLLREHEPARMAR